MHQSLKVENIMIYENFLLMNDRIATKKLSFQSEEMMKIMLLRV